MWFTKGHYNFSWLGLSTQPVYPTNPTNQLEPEPKTAQTDTSMVGDGSPPTKPDAFGSVGGFPTPKPEQPDPIINPETFGDIRRFFNENIQNLAIFETIRRKFTWNPSDWTRSGEILLRSSPDPTRSDEISLRSGEISLRSSEILLWSGQISTDPAKYQLDLDGSGQNNGIRDKNWNRPMNLKTQRDPNRPIRLAFRVRHKPDPWTPLLLTMTYYGNYRYNALGVCSALGWVTIFFL